MSGQARILDGRAVAAAWQDELAHDVQDVSMRGGRPPGLGVVLVGSRPDSLLYVSRKREACEKVRHMRMRDSVVGAVDAGCLQLAEGVPVRCMSLAGTIAL